MPGLPNFSDEQYRALISFRKRHGHRWKTKLLDMYLFGRDAMEPEGSTLREIRNHHGPRRIHAMPRRVLDAAEARLKQPE